MQIGSTVQWTPDGSTYLAGIIVGDLVEPTFSTDRNNPGQLTPGRADLVVWSAAGVPSFKNNVVEDNEQSTPNSFRPLI